MFEITIKEIKTETKTVRGEWVTLNNRLVTEKDIEPSVYNTNRELRDQVLSKQVVLMSEKGYAPDVQREVESTHEIFTQRVESLDLPAVIKAINNI